MKSYLDRILRLESHDSVTSVDGSDKGVLILDSDDVADGRHVQLGGHPGEEAAGEGAGPGDDVRELELVLAGHQQRGQLLGQEVGEGGVVGHQDLGHALDPGHLLGHPLAAGSGHQTGDVSAHSRGRGDGIESDGGELGVVMLSNN